MLTIEQEKLLRQLGLFDSAEWLEDGKMLDADGNEFYFPYFGDLIKMAMNYILENGFSKVDRVSPTDVGANCIIRISEVHNFVHGENVINLYDIDFFTRENGTGTWLMTDIEGKDSEINYSTHTIEFFLTQEEKVFIEPDFVDIYVQVK